jgi:ABC-type Na+ efflux pump permease subunit
MSLTYKSGFLILSFEKSKFILIQYELTTHKRKEVILMKRFILLIVAVLFVFASAPVSFAANTPDSGTPGKVETKAGTGGSAAIKSMTKGDKNVKALKIKGKAAEIEKARKENAENAYNVKSG